MVKRDAALLKAVQTSSDAEVATLLNCGVDPNGAKHDEYGVLVEFRQSPLILAMGAASVEKVKLLLAAKAGTHDILRNARPLRPSGLVDNALHVLVDHWNDKDMKAFREIGILLLASGLDVNARDSSGLTALHRAVDFGEFELCRFLLEQEADPTTASDNWERITPIEAASDSGLTKILGMFMEDCGKQTDEMARLFTPFHRVAKFGNWNSMLLPLVELGVDVNALDIYGNQVMDVLPCTGNNHLKAFFAFIAIGSKPSTMMLDIHDAKTSIGKAIRTDRLPAALRCGNAGILKKVLWELPKIASSVDVATAESAATKASGDRLEVLKHWISAQAAQRIVGEL